ncbi:integrase [Candidatus Micrarchaeota archaeon]|nr:MAG: integrase [Candidatus Micrarchaeota archaeon]
MAGRGFKIPEVLTREEQEALLRQPNPRYPTGERNRLLLRVMLDTGLRLSEAINLRWRDLDLLTGRLHVKQGKGAKDRVLWVGDELLELLRKWRERQAKVVGWAPEHVFTTLDGKPLQARYVQYMVKRYAQRAGITKNVHPHTLRHTFATDLLRETRNIRLVQKALGHANLATTQIYTHIVDEELEAALKSFRETARITINKRSTGRKEALVVAMVG